jgi:hypothetical protein
MYRTSYIIPIDKASNPVLEGLRTAGQLQRTDEYVPGAGTGTIYRMDAALSATIAAASDFGLQIGTEVIDADVYRMPERPYSLMVRASPSFSQRHLDHLTSGLLVGQAAFDVTAWSTALVAALQTPLVVGPDPRMVSEPWSPEGQFVQSDVRLIDRDGKWSVHLPFDLPHSRDLEPGTGMVMAVDAGLRPLMTVAIFGGGTWATGSVAQLSLAQRRQLLIRAAAAGLPREDVLQALRLLTYAAARQLLEEGFLLPLIEAAAVVIYERLSYEGMSTGVAQATRDLAIRDCLTAWLPQLARIHGIDMIQVPPAYTSMDCCRCNTRHAPQQVTFQCTNPRCLYNTGVHQNAAWNILKRGTSSLY